MDRATLITTIVSAVTSIVVTLVTFFATYKWTKKLERGDEKRKELERRLDPHENVRRIQTENATLWDVNPYWIEYEDAEDFKYPIIREWRSHTLWQSGKIEGLIGVQDNTVQTMLKWDSVALAKSHRCWLRFKAGEKTLDLIGEVPVDAADAFLFQPLPKVRK